MPAAPDRAMRSASFPASGTSGGRSSSHVVNETKGMEVCTNVPKCFPPIEGSVFRLDDHLGDDLLNGQPSPRVRDTVHLVESLCNFGISRMVEVLVRRQRSHFQERERDVQRKLRLIYVHQLASVGMPINRDRLWAMD